MRAKIFSATLASVCCLFVTSVVQAQTFTHFDSDYWPTYDNSGTFMGLSSRVCLNATTPPTCTPTYPGTVIWGYGGAGWTAITRRCPEARWLWAPGLSGASTPASLEEYSFERTFVIGKPIYGVVFVAADDLAEVIVNGIPVGSVGSVTSVSAAAPASANLSILNITGALVPGANTIRVRAKNGPDAFAGCSGACSYQMNPAGVVFCGDIVSH
jgi:hypothetical protein